MYIYTSVPGEPVHFGCGHHHQIRKKEKKKKKEKTKLTDNDTLSFVSFRLLFYYFPSLRSRPDDTSVMTPLLANSLGLTGASHKS